MSIYERIVPGRYWLIVGDEDGGIKLHILDSNVARKLGTTLIWTYDGIMWTKASGGRALKLKDFVSDVGLDENDLKMMKMYLKGIKNAQGNR